LGVLRLYVLLLAYVALLLMQYPLRALPSVTYLVLVVDIPYHLPALPIVSFSFDSASFTCFT